MYKKIIMSVKKSKIKNINSGKKLQIYQLYMREREREPDDVHREQNGL